MPVALALPFRDGRLLVARRPADSHQGGLWEFPGGRIEDGEDPASAARRELLEETRLRAATLEPLITVLFDYPDRPVMLHAYLALEPEGEPPDGMRWVSLSELSSLPMPEANGPIVTALRRRLGAS